MMAKSSKALAGLGILLILVLMSVSVGFAAKKPFEGMKINIAAFAGGPKGVISGVLYEHRAEWEQLTGASLVISEIPYGAMYEKIFTDLVTGAGRYDGFLCQAWFLGDLVSGGYAVPIDRYMNDKAFPSWDPEQVMPPVRALLKWGDNWYAPPFDCDQFVLWYRKDVLSDARWQAKFKAKHGYNLPNPPRTIEELIDVAKFFNGWDWNGDGDQDYGVALFLKGGSMGGYFYGMAVTAPYAVMPGPTVDRFHNVFWFDPVTMEPLINTPGYVEGLKKLKELVQGGPTAMLSWDLGESWDAFVRGKAVFAINTADIGSLAQKSAEVRGKLGATPIPGTMKVWDREKGAWVQLKRPNVVGNLFGANWQGIISKYSKHPEAVYHLFAFLAQKDRLFKAAAAGWTGVDPTCYYQFLPPYGTATLDEYIAEGWDRSDAQVYSNALYENVMHADTYVHYLRIRGTNDFALALDIAVNKFLTGQISAEGALNEAAKAWTKTIDSLGREQLRREYLTSIGYGGKPTP